MHTKGSILWIVLLQARQFGLGEVNVLYEFQSMHDDLRAKRAQISHSEVPSELFANSTPGSEDGQREREAEPKAKKPRTANPCNWHPKLKAALAKPLADASNPSFTEIINYYGKKSYDIISRNSRVCAPNAFFGSCFAGSKCTKLHNVLREDQVPQVLKLVEKFIKEPKKLVKGP